MHPNPAYRDTDESRALGAARQRGFGVLTVAGPEGVLASHMPFVFEDGAVAGHLSRAGAVARRLREGPAEALLIVSGPDGYISPDWYGLEDQVPTWNYVAVHLRGALSLLPDEALRPHLDRLSAEHEAHLLPKKPWTTDKMTPGVIERMMRQIVPVRMTVADVDSTFKLTQNKVDSARLSAADAVEVSAHGHETAALAALMRAPRGV